MADGPDKSEKTLPPTPQRLKKAREEGNVFRARELISIGMLTLGVAVLFTGAPLAFESMKDFSRRIFLETGSVSLTEQSVMALLSEMAMKAGLMLLPLFLVLVAGAILLNVVQSGWNFTFKPLAPKGNRISPQEGAKRIFSTKGLFELLKGLLKISIIAPLVYFMIAANMPRILTLPALPLDGILSTAVGWILTLLIQMIVVLLILTIIDFAFQRYKYIEGLKMSPKEVKDEMRESEGDPQIKVKRRQAALKMSRKRRLDHAVLNSDVVVTNPTHYAVALRYDPNADGAPRVMVKGMRKRALRIKALALENEIPVIEDPPLARALYKSAPEEQEIPHELYQAVAAVLAEVYRQRSKRNTYRPGG